MNPKLPPLPEPDMNYKRSVRGVWTESDCITMEKATAYGLQCAEAERARCKHIVDSMVQVVKETERPESLQSYRDYTAQLLEFLSEKLSGK